MSAIRCTPSARMREGACYGIRSAEHVNVMCDNDALVNQVIQVSQVSEVFGQGRRPKRTVCRILNSVTLEAKKKDKAATFSLRQPAGLEIAKVFVLFF